VKKLVKFLDVDTETEKAVRLGKKKENKENRPLLLTVKDEKIKWRIISRGKMLRGNKDWDNVFIAPDLTTNERKLEMELKKSLKQAKEESSKTRMGRSGQSRKENLCHKQTKFKKQIIRSSCKN